MNFGVFLRLFQHEKKTAQWIRIILIRLLSTWVLNKPFKFWINSLDRIRCIVVTSLKNTVLRKTPLKVQIRLPPIKFWLTINLLSATCSTSIFGCNLCKKNIQFFEPVTRDDPFNVIKLSTQAIWEVNFIRLLKSLRKSTYLHFFRDCDENRPTSIKQDFFLIIWYFLSIAYVLWHSNFRSAHFL